MSIYLLWGQEDFNLENRLGELKKQYVAPEFASMSCKILRNPPFDTLVEALCTQPFMFGSVFIIVNAEGYFLGGKKDAEPSEDKKDTDFSDNNLKKLEEILQTLNENVHVVFVCKIPRDTNKKIDTRKKLYKVISKYAKVEEFPPFKVYDKALPEWIKKCAKSKDLSCNEACAKFLIDICGANLRTLDSELEKIKLSIYPKKEITEQAVREICNPVEDVFKILDLYIDNKRDCALNELKKINEKQHYLITLATLNTTVRNALNIKLLSKECSPAQISQQTGIHEYVVKLQMEKLRKISAAQLIKLKTNLAKAESQSRSGMSWELAFDMALM